MIFVVWDTPEIQIYGEAVAMNRLINSLTIDSNAQISLCARNVCKIRCHNWLYY